MPGDGVTGNRKLNATTTIMGLYTPESGGITTPLFGESQSPAHLRHFFSEPALSLATGGAAVCGNQGGGRLCAHELLPIAAGF